MRRLQIILSFNPFREAWIEYPSEELEIRDIDKTMTFLKVFRPFIADSLKPDTDDDSERIARLSDQRRTSAHAD